MNASKFISSNECITLVGDGANRGGYACGGAGVMWDISYLPLNFAVNLGLP